MKILMLYTQLAGYWMNCIHEYLSLYEDEFVIVRDRVSSEAPYNFTPSDRIRIYDHDHFTKKELLEFCVRENADVVYVTGWIYNDYLDVARYYFKKNIPVICGLDNPWQNTLRQKYGAIYSKLYLTKRFSHVWVPGKSQFEFARRLGFPENKILYGLYSANYKMFYNEYLKNREKKSNQFPHRFIYVGRYNNIKGISDLWKAFEIFHNESKSDWELWALGTGELFEKRLHHPKVFHKGFVQPKEMPNYLKETGVLVLPSHSDHWGVAVHEFAAAGFPLICSHKVEAASSFLENGKNGFIHTAGDIKSLKESMIKISMKTDSELLKMGDISARFAGKITPGDWAKTLKKVADTRKLKIKGE